MVAAVVLVFVFIFCTVLLFHLVQQNRYNTATQLESIARSVREPLSSAILKGDIPEAEAILASIKPAGVVSRADVVLPNQFQALRKSFIPERPVPVMVTRLFELPVQISLGVYSLERPANPQPIAYLVLQADSFRMYKFVMSTLSTLVTIYLLLSLILTVAISWCINRLILHPLRNIARELNAIPPQELVGHQLALPRLHQDDEIGMLVRSYNLNQQLLQRHYEEQNENAMRFPVSDLPNKALLMEMLEQVVARKQTTALMIITCETLRDTAGVLKEAQREILLLTLVEKLKSVLSPRMILAQISGYDFAVIANGVQEPWHAITLGQQVLTIMSERLPIERIQLRPHCSIGVAMFYGDLTAEQLYSRAISAAFTARHKGKNQIQFFDPQQMEAAQQRLTEESDILNALENHQFAIWLQPQVEMTSGKLVSAEVLLRIQQPDGSWDLPDGLIDRIECCGLMVTVGHWVLEESCRLLAAWQERGIMLPLSVNLSALQLMHPNMVADMLELMYPGRSKVYISDGIGKKLASMKEKRNVVRYSMIAEDIVSYLKEIEEELQSRYELLAKGIESDPAEADYMLLIIDNPDAIEQISNSKEALASYKNIIGRYRNMNVGVIISAIENAPIPYSAPEVIKGIRDGRHLMYFGDISELKIYDMPLAVTRKFKKPIETGDGYYIKENECIKLKTPFIAGE